MRKTHKPKWCEVLGTGVDVNHTLMGNVVVAIIKHTLICVTTN